MNEFLKKKIKHRATRDEIRADELTLKKFGLVPQDFDLSSSTVDLLTEQAAAFYDYDRKKLFITDSTANDSEEPVLAMSWRTPWRIRSSTWGSSCARGATATTVRRPAWR